MAGNEGTADAQDPELQEALTKGAKTPGFPGFALLASERRLREEGERGGREGGGVLGLNPTPSRSTRLDRIENFPINFFPKK